MPSSVNEPLVFRDLAIGERVAHREDTVLTFTGRVESIDASSGRPYGVTWEDDPDVGMQWYSRCDLVATDDEDGKDAAASIIEPVEDSLKWIARIVRDLEAEVEHHDDDCEQDCESEACFIADDEKRAAAAAVIDGFAVRVRATAWYDPERQPPVPNEFTIELTKGVPTVRILGELRAVHAILRPVHARVQYRYPETGWNDLAIRDRHRRRALEAFCEAFVYG